MKMTIALIAALSVPCAAVASEVPKNLLAVAAYAGVPSDIFYAVALQESGRTVDGHFAPYPWTLNIAGEAKYYDTRQAMFEDLMLALQSGVLSIDIGPLQVNWRWQSQRLGSLWLSTDPTHSAKVGSQILAAHYRDTGRDTGDWWKAVGRYHRASTQPQHVAAATAYSERVKRRWEAL